MVCITIIVLFINHLLLPGVFIIPKYILFYFVTVIFDSVIFIVRLKLKQLYKTDIFLQV